MSFLQGFNALIPTPAQGTHELQAWPIPAQPCICVDDPSLAALAELLAGDMQTLTGRSCQINSAPADIRLSLDATLSEEGYELAVDAQGVRITAGSAVGATWAVSTLLQSLVIDHDHRAFGFMRIGDAPRYGFRALMVDVARQPHTLQTLEKLVEICRWYKIRFLQIHLADTEGIAFPFAAYPDLARPDRVISIEDWKSLEQFAAQRQVILLPEFDVPGHACEALRRLCPTHPSTTVPVINPVAESTFAHLEVIFDELLATFPRSPFVHIGADEVLYDGWKNCTDCREFLQTHQLNHVTEVYRHFIVRMHELVRRRGKRMIVWEGFAAHGQIPIPPDIIVQHFELQYLMPQGARALGHPIINAAWGPLYIVPGPATHPLSMIYQWHPGLMGTVRLSCVTDAFDDAPAFAGCDRFDRFYDRPLSGQQIPFAVSVPVDDPGLLGSMLCSWEMADHDEVSAIRRRAAAMSQRVWNPAGSPDFAGFLLQLETQDYRLDQILLRVSRAHRR